MLEIIEKDIEPSIYQVAGDAPLSTNELIQLIAKSQSKKASIWIINPRLINWAAYIEDQLHLPINSERLKKLKESYVVSNVKLKNTLHIEKMPVTATEGLKITLESFQK